MTFPEIVALAGVSATVLVAAIGATTQIVLERLRRKAERDVRMEERWLDQRLDLYARFLEGADACIQSQRDRNLFLYSLSRGEFDGLLDEKALFSPPGALAEHLEMCATSLSRMRLFAPAAVNDAATEFMEATRQEEHFGGLQILEAIEERQAVASGGEPLHPQRPTPAPSDHLQTLGKRLVAAMRADLGADTTAEISLGNPAEPIPYL